MPAVILPKLEEGSYIMDIIRGQVFSSRSLRSNCYVPKKKVQIRFRYNG
jgi:hypothetical protein